MESEYSLDWRLRMKKISIIIPVYNVEKYLKKCLKSILAQTFWNLEIILINSGSDDLSGEICNKYAEKDDRIIVLHTENNGVSAARNEGLEIASGDYIAFCDADDFVEADMYEYLVCLLEEQGGDIATCCGWYEYSKHSKIFYELEEPFLLLHQQEAIREVYRKKICSSWMWDKLFKKELFEDIRFRKDLELGEDHDVVCQCMEKIQLLVCGKEPKYHYIQRKASVCNNGYKLSYRNTRAMYLERMKCYSEKYPEDKDIFFQGYMLETMAFITAMIKGEEYIYPDCNEVKKEIQKNLFRYIRLKDVSLSLKCSAILLSVSKRMFSVFYKILRQSDFE